MTVYRFGWPFAQSVPIPMRLQTSERFPMSDRLTDADWDLLEVYLEKQFLDHAQGRQPTEVAVDSVSSLLSMLNMQAVDGLRTFLKKSLNDRRGQIARMRRGRFKIVESSKIAPAPGQMKK